MKRNLITIALFVAAGLFLLVIWRGSGDEGQTPTQPTPAADTGAAETAADAAPPDAPGASDTAPNAEATTTTPAADVEPIDGLRVRVVGEVQPEPVIGSIEPGGEYLSALRVSPYGAGIKSLELRDYKIEVGEDAHYAVQSSLVRSVEQRADAAVTRYRYPMAVYAAVVNGTTVNLWEPVWRYVPGDSREGESAVFELVLEDGEGRDVLRIRRLWRVEPGRYDVHIEHELQNLTAQPLRVALSHYGPGDMPYQRGYIGDRRHVTVGYLEPASRDDPSLKRMNTEGVHEFRKTVLEAETAVVWSDATAGEGEEMVWVAMTNRYFAAALHGVVERGTLADVSRAQVLREAALGTTYRSVRRDRWPAGADAADQTLMLVMDARPVSLGPAGADGDARSLAIDLYAGPKDPVILEEDSVYSALQMTDLIVYNLGGMCAFCTFAWLADFLIGFLRLLHAGFRDWGVAIIGLVAVVRLILHPLTKNAQVNMMTLGRQMQAIQPEMERIKEKYKDDQQRQQKELLNLYREKGVNPAKGAMGCLPMFFQMPIWVALYAMLYFAIELRHESAFWGVFQSLGMDWKFLADLSSPDRFIPLGAGFNVPIIGWHVDSINILPILMAVVFFLQQKYMTAQTPNMSEQQQMQQKMMRMMTLLFPVFLYAAPSGLTLYMVTSSTVGIVESRRVRRHIKDLEERGELGKPRPKKEHKPGGLMDRLSKVVEQRKKQIQKMQKQQGGKGQGGRNRRR